MPYSSDSYGGMDDDKMLAKNLSLAVSVTA